MNDDYKLEKDVRDAIYIIKKAEQGKVNIPELKKVLTKKDLEFFSKVKRYYDGVYNNEPFNIEYTKDDPYINLSIDKREYTKDELLEIIGGRINQLKNSNAKNKEEKINIILDSYNEIINSKGKGI